jgi:hypothetical protein
VTWKRESSHVHRSSAYRELGDSRVGATKICVKGCEVARGDISANRHRLACGTTRSEWKTGGIGDRRIGDPEDVSPIHFSFAKFEFSIGERTWSGGPTGHMRKK